MNEITHKGWSYKIFPERRFDSDFPLPFWFAGLWLYLKAFLYICYLYGLGLEPTPYTIPMKVEIAYFAVAFLPAFIIGLGLWNQKKWAHSTSVVFLVVDTPFLVYHVWRLADAGYLSTGLTKFLELGSLGINFLALGWLISYFAAKKTVGS